MQWVLDLLSKSELGHRATSSASEDGGGDDSEDDRYGRARRLLVAQQLQRQQQQRPHLTHTILEDDIYFRDCRYQGHQKQIALCYDRFVQHSPLVRFAQHHQRFSAVPHLLGLEYLAPQAPEPPQAQAEFPCIFLGAPWSPAQSVDQASETFLVQRRLDYMYHYIIEFAYMGCQRDWRIPDAMHRQRQAHRTRRIRSYAACPLHGQPQQQCPYEYVVYTKKTCDFYRTCVTLLQGNGQLAYDAGMMQALTTPLSYNLVSFLCGPFDGPIQGEAQTQWVRDYDQWVIVPVYFIDLWRATRLVGQLNRQATNNNTNNACNTTDGEANGADDARSEHGEQASTPL